MGAACSASGSNSNFIEHFPSGRLRCGCEDDIEMYLIQN
jgi:hypothetical protein